MRFVKCLASGVLLALSVSAVVPLAAGQAAPSAAQTGEAKAEDEVRRLSAEEVQAFLNRDSKTMTRLWSDDFVVTNPLNRFVTKQQVLGMVDAGVLVIASFDRQIEYLKAYGDTVIVAGRETVLWGGKMPNAGRTERLRFTAIWMKQQDRWQQVARHANVVPEK
jgi:ketosteroid isomerase-like protein